MGKYSPSEHSFRLLVCLVATILLLSSSVSNSVSASRYAAMLMQPRTTVATPPVVLQSGTAGTSTIYTNNTSARVSVGALNWLSGWDKRVKITVNSSDIDEALVDFPVLVHLSNSSSGENDEDVSFIFDELQSDNNRKKIAVTTSDGTTQCYVEIERWNDTSEQAWLWVKVPNISNTTDTALYVYYDKDKADNIAYVDDTASGNSTKVWDSNFKAVLHLNQTPSGLADEIKDSTSYANHGTTEGSMNSTDLVDAKIGGGLEFDEIDDLVRVPNSTGLSFNKSSGTCELWINWVNASDGDSQIVMASSNRFTVGAQDGFEWASQGSGNHFFYPWGGDGSNYNLGPNPFTNGVWHHLVVTCLYATKEVKIYVDATSMSFTTENVPTYWIQLANTADWLWGGNPDRPTRYFDGMFDEIRIHSEARSDSWIEASYESGRDDLLTFGSEEKNIEDFVDNNTSDVGSPTDIGTHSNFTAQQYGPDSIYDALTEENTGGWKVQSGTGSIGLGNTYTTVNIDPVTLSKSFLLVEFGGGIAGTQPEQDVIVSGNFSSASQLRFDRIGTTNPANFGWYVIEALGTQISVQSGTTQFASTETQKDVTITDVADTSKCVIFLSRRSTGTDRTQYNRCFVTGELTSATNLRLKRQGTGTVVTVEWFVVKFDDGTTIQTGETAVSTSNPTTQSISSVDLSRTWLYFTWSATANGLAQVSPRGWLESSTEIRWFRQTTTGICYVRWFVIQMPSGTSVQRGYHDSTVTTEYTKDITITPVAPNRTFSFTTCDSTGTGDYFPRPFWIERITSTTNLHLERWYTGQTSDHNWQIIELPVANYELDLEVQWTDIPALLPNEELCIYGGTMGSEDIKVDVWNGSAWKNVFTDLSTGWNNVSITSYLNSSTFTIRFKGGTETGDTNQDSWNIDATLLHVWSSIEITYDYVLRVNNTVTDSWQIRLKEYSNSSVGRLQNCTIYFHNSTDGNSPQIVIENGSFINETGSWYNMGTLETIYIAMTVEANSTGTSHVYVYLEVLIPNTTTYAQYIIVFEIT